MDPQKLEKLKQIRQHCINHAKDLLGCAQILAQKNRNIAFHLAALALEEVGKIAMLTAGYIREEKGRSIIAQAGDDHVKKIFWALWGPLMGKGKITKEQVLQYQELAKTFHEKRLMGLYVSTDIENPVYPKDAISDQELETIISLTEARIGLEEHIKMRESDNQLTKDLIWFQEASEDIEKRKLMFGSKSLEKLQEIGEVAGWVHWMHEQFEIADKEAKALVEKELKAATINEGEKIEPKWQIRVCLYSLSHTIRQNVLNKWNEGSLYIKLSLGREEKRKRELIVDFTLTKSVPLQALWIAGWGHARRFALALNIGSHGYFWWQVPKDISRFYQRIKDLENNSEVIIERNPQLSLDWGKLTLTENNLGNTSLAMAFLPFPNDQEKFKPYNCYTTGITLLAKNDIHLQSEPQIFMCFYDALKFAMELYGNYKPGEVFSEVADRVFKSMGDFDGHKELIRLAENYQIHGKFEKEITLSEACSMKLICDLYLVRTFQRLADENFKTEDGAEESKS